MQTIAAKGNEHKEPETKVAEQLLRALRCIAGGQGPGQTMAETSDLAQLIVQCGEAQKKQVNSA